MTKFVQSFDPNIYADLEKIAKARGVTVQALIRQVIGEWIVREYKEKKE